MEKQCAIINVSGSVAETLRNELKKRNTPSHSDISWKPGQDMTQLIVNGEVYNLYPMPTPLVMEAHKTWDHSQCFKAGDVTTGWSHHKPGRTTTRTPELSEEHVKDMERKLENIYHQQTVDEINLVEVECEEIVEETKKEDPSGFLIHSVLPSSSSMSSSSPSSSLSHDAFSHLSSSSSSTSLPHATLSKFPPSSSSSSCSTTTSSVSTSLPHAALSKLSLSSSSSCSTSASSSSASFSFSTALLSSRLTSTPPTPPILKTPANGPTSEMTRLDQQISSLRTKMESTLNVTVKKMYQKTLESVVKKKEQLLKETNNIHV